MVERLVLAAYDIQHDNIRRRAEHAEGWECKQVREPRTGRVIADFQYRPETGRIGGIFVDEGFRFRGLEQQILIYMMHEMKAVGATHIWDVTAHGDRMFDGLWSFAFRSRICGDSNCTGPGYAMIIPERPHTLVMTDRHGKYESYGTVPMWPDFSVGKNQEGEPLVHTRPLIGVC